MMKQEPLGKDTKLVPNYISANELYCVPWAPLFKYEVMQLEYCWQSAQSGICRVFLAAGCFDIWQQSSHQPRQR